MSIVTADKNLLDTSIKQVKWAKKLVVEYLNNASKHIDKPYPGNVQETVESFAKRLDELAQLPLWVAYYDLNDVNVLINKECEVTALIDWELSAPLPFGAGFGRIHTIPGEYTGGEF
ncbi:hypothetical protein F5Y09DRAFT_344693 [Xylaria sp. FL1042]|nr:hypothetical protein F5Y09DRAFT_344693 [Xylaria sp. FL1042]